MAEIPDVVGGETILTSWGNPIRDRTIQRYADATERATLLPVPTTGDVSYLTGIASLEIYDGAEWIPYLDKTGGVITGRLELDNGSQTAPAFTFHGKKNTGMYLGATNDLRFVVDGTNATRITPTYVAQGDPFGVGGWRLLVGQIGSPTDPAYAFVNDSGTGMFRAATSRLGFSAGGVEMTNVRANYATGSEADSNTMRNILTGVGAPDPAWGKDGDLYFRRET